MAVTLYHNPRCAKSRQALALIRGRGIEPEVIEYLETPPSAAELDRILCLLGLKPRDLLRKKESKYKELRLDRPDASDAELVRAMVQHPILIERPIVIANDKAVIGRPPEQALAIL